MSDLLPIPDHLSFSQITTLLPVGQYHCARKWAIDKRLGVPYEASPAMRVGSAFDRAVSMLFYPRTQAGGDPSVPLDLATAQDVLLAEGQLILDEAADEDVDLAGTLASLPLSLEAYAGLHSETPAVAVQQKVVWWSGGEQILSFIDRVDADRRITDLKVSGRSPKMEDEECVDDRLEGWMLQLAFYAAALENEALDHGLEFAWPVPVAIDAVTVRKGQAKPRIDVIPGWVTEGDRDRVHELIAQGRAAKHSGVYPPNPGPGCDRCSYQAICRRMSMALEPSFEELVGRLK